MSRYLVTGGCGFIGSHLADRLLGAGHDVVVLDDLSTGRRENLNPQAKLIVGDVGDRALLQHAMAGVDGCFHLAAISSVVRCNEDWIGSHRTNLTGTISVLDAARCAPSSRTIPVVYASSAAVYGDTPVVPTPESAPTKPLTVYGADKLACELHARAGWLTHRVPSVGMRIFNVYGPRQVPNSAYSGVISTFIYRLVAGLPITIDGDGQQVRDFVQVSDVVTHLLSAMAHANGGAKVFNVCTGRAISVRQIAEILAHRLGGTPNIQHGPGRAGDIRRSIGSPDAATAELGIAAGVTVEEGLSALIEHVHRETPAVVAREAE